MNKLARVALTVTVFLAVLLWRFPYYGNDSDPPQLFNVFNQRISNESAVMALALAAIAAAIVWFVTGRLWSGSSSISASPDQATSQPRRRSDR